MSTDDERILSLPKNESEREKGAKVLGANAAQQTASPNEIAESNDFTSMEILKAATGKESTCQVTEVEHLVNEGQPLMKPPAQDLAVPTETHQEYSWP